MDTSALGWVGKTVCAKASSTASSGKSKAGIIQYTVQCFLHVLLQLALRREAPYGPMPMDICETPLDF